MNLLRPLVTLMEGQELLMLISVCSVAMSWALTFALFILVRKSGLCKFLGVRLWSVSLFDTPKCIWNSLRGSSNLRNLIWCSCFSSDVRHSFLSYWSCRVVFFVVRNRRVHFGIGVLGLGMHSDWVGS